MRISQIYGGQIHKAHFTDALNGYFVEMKLIPYFNTVESITAFEDGDQLDPYLEEIDISHLLKEVNI